MRRSPVLIVSLSAVLGLGVAAASATAPKGLTRTETSRATLTGGGPVDFQAGKQAVVLHVTIEPGAAAGGTAIPARGCS